MPTAKGVLRAAARRGRRFSGGVASATVALRPLGRTALRVPPDRRPPDPSAFARHGERSFVVPPARITGAAGIEIGDDVLVLEDCGVYVDVVAGARLVIGDRVRLAPGVEIACTIGVTIEPGVSSSDYVAIIDTWGPVPAAPGSPSPPGGPIVIETGAYLGWGSVIGPGVRVGAGAFVGEGAVVLDDVEPHTVVYGNPARAVRRLDAATRNWEGPRFP